MLAQLAANSLYWMLSIEINVNVNEPQPHPYFVHALAVHMANSISSILGHQNFFPSHRISANWLWEDFYLFYLYLTLLFSSVKMKACPVGDQLNVLISLLVTLTASDIFLLGCNSFPLGVDNNFVRLHFFLFFIPKEYSRNRNASLKQLHV